MIWGSSDLSKSKKMIFFTMLPCPSLITQMHRPCHHTHHLQYTARLWEVFRPNLLPVAKQLSRLNLFFSVIEVLVFYIFHGDSFTLGRNILWSRYTNLIPQGASNILFQFLPIQRGYVKYILSIDRSDCYFFFNAFFLTNHLYSNYISTFSPLSCKREDYYGYQSLLNLNHAQLVVTGIIGTPLGTGLKLLIFHIQRPNSVTSQILLGRIRHFSNPGSYLIQHKK